MSDSRATAALGGLFVVAGLLLFAGAMGLERYNHRATQPVPSRPQLAEQRAPDPDPPAPGAAQPATPAPVLLEATLVARPVELPVLVTTSGRLEWLADDGASIAAGETVARLEGAANARRRMDNYEQRREYYQRKADQANARQAEAAAARDTDGLRRYGALYAKAKAKVEEKQSGIDDSRARLRALELTASAPGTFSRSVRAGHRVAEGDTIGVITRTEFVATFSVEGASSLFSADQEILIEHRFEARSTRCTAVAVSTDQATVTCPNGDQLGDGTPVQVSVERR